MPSEPQTVPDRILIRFFFALFAAITSAVVLVLPLTVATLEVKANIFVAVGTLALAVTTWWSVSETRAVIAAEERRHQQRLSPVCVLQEASSRLEGIDLDVSLWVVNIGTGPAMWVNLRLIPVGTGLVQQAVAVVMPVGAMLAGAKKEIKYGPAPWAGSHPTGFVRINIEFENMFQMWGTSDWLVKDYSLSRLSLKPCDVTIKPTIL